MKLREAAQQALYMLEAWARDADYEDYWRDVNNSINDLRAALAEPQSTHSADCWKWHHECAIAKIERESKHE